MMKTNKERQAALRKRRVALGQKEIRNIWATDSDKAIWTAEANKKGMKLNAFFIEAVNGYIKALNKES